MRNKHNIKHLLILISTVTTAQKMKFSINDFFSKCDQIRSKLRIWSRLLKKSFMEDFFFCAAYWMSFHFCFFFFSWYSYRNYKFRTWIKNLCNNCINCQYFMLLSCHVSVSQLIHTLELPECQVTPSLFTK